jgi:threonyl-tRNA synthetase
LFDRTADMTGANDGQAKERLERMRHSASHIMAQAVQTLFPDAKFGIGPAIEDGFYYDFDLPRALTPEDLAKIEEEMRKTIAADLPFVHQELGKRQAQSLFVSQPYKLELIQDLPDETVSIYRQGPFVDLCRGPHVASTGEVKAFKLTHVAGAYWRGDEKRPMLQRIYGVAFETQAELDAYLARLEEAARRDHRRLGKELDFFSIHEEAGPGLVHWHPRGAMVRHIIETFWKDEHFKRGYDIVNTPHIAKLDLWKTSGHWDFYRENLYSPMEIEGQEYIIKPMNCVFHILIYKSKLHSYRSLPVRYAELGTVYRYERSGVLHGLARVRGFTQDDAHIFCRPDQLEAELKGALDLARFMMKTFGFSEYELILSTRPAVKFAGTIEMWDQAEGALRRVLEGSGLPYKVEEGEGAFYGPKIDIKLKDALGRFWQGPTIQCDFNLPQRFDVVFTNAGGKEERVVMIHRTVLGSMERFMASLLEHYAGAFPVWLAPVQAVIIPIADRHTDYAGQVAGAMRNEGLRVQVDDRAERMNLKIREAQLAKVPYILVVGDKEVQSGAVALRLRTGEDLGAQSLASVISRVKTAAESRSQSL